MAIVSTQLNGFNYGYLTVEILFNIDHLFTDNVSKVKYATIVEGDPKAPFSIATTPRCRGGRYSFPGLLHFTLDP